MKKEEGIKICNRCGKENTASAESCDCGSVRFAPDWVLAKRPINRQFGVEVTKTNPQFGPVEKRITLSKWWVGGKSSLHIPNLAQWEVISYIINTELAPFLGWKTRKELLKTVKEKQNEAKTIEQDVKALITQHPDFIKQVVEAIDTKKISEENFGELIDFSVSLANTMSDSDRGFREAFLSIVKKLPQEKKKALEELEELLSGWSLQQVTSVAQQVKNRLNTIELFKNQIVDDRTYEIRGATSIHRILEKSMWLIDERYWLLHSNETLLKFIGDEMSKRDKKKFGKKRPDFACGTIGDKLIIIEIKRPSHTLTIEDLNQLETYLTIAEEYKTFRSFEGYLIGRKIDQDLSRRLRHRSNNFKVLTYSDLLESAEKRYSEYLKVTSD